MFKTLKGKITLVYVGLVVLTAAVGFISVLSLWRMEGSVNGLMSNNYKSISAVQKMSGALDQEDNAIIAYLMQGEKSGIDKFYEGNNLFSGYYRIESGNVTEKGEQDYVNHIGTQYNALLKSFTEIRNMQEIQGKAVAAGYYASTVRPIISKLRAEMNNIITLNQNAMFRKKNNTSSDVKAAVYVLLAVTCIAVIGGFLTARHFVGHFLAPLSALTDGINRVRAGKFGFTINVDSNDEFGKLAAEFNEMVRRLSAFEQSTMGTLMDERNKSIAIMKSIGNPLFVLSTDLHITFLNDASENFFGLKEDEAVGRHFLEVIHDSTFYDIIDNSAREKQSNNVIRLKKNGEDCFFNVVLTPVRGRTDASGYILILQDITRIKKLEHVKKNFFATVSHEIKTPLTSIMMGASMLTDGNMGNLNQEQTEVVKAIIEDSQKLSNFVRELLEIEKMDSGKTVYSFAPCAIYAIAENSCRQFREMAELAGVKLENTISERLPFILADFEKVTWIFNNLLGNALKHTGSGDSINVAAQAADGFVRVTVSDTGEGIQKEFHSKIFERYTRIEKPDDTAGGTGLGLSVAKSIVTAHGGKIGVESEPGQGSTFWFTLPQIKENSLGRA